MTAMDDATAPYITQAEITRAQCDNYHKWLHRKCMGLTNAQFKELTSVIDSQKCTCRESALIGYSEAEIQPERSSFLSTNENTYSGIPSCSHSSRGAPEGVGLPQQGPMWSRSHY